MPSLTTLPVRDLRRAIANLEDHRERILPPSTTSLSGSEVMALHRKERSGGRRTCFLMLGPMPPPALALVVTAAAPRVPRE
jgi:hypothetical protein